VQTIAITLPTKYYFKKCLNGIVVFAVQTTEAVCILSQTRRKNNNNNNKQNKTKQNKTKQNKTKQNKTKQNKKKKITK
jgi:mannitol-specific phosphotransferase system IIBC component